MRLIITRHGETRENVKGIIQGHLPGKLSNNGEKQTKKLALRLKNENFDIIYSSDLARAANTARAIAVYHPKVPLKYTKNLRETYFGRWQGKSKEELGLTIKKIMSEDFPSEAESYEDLYKRADDFLHQVLAKHRNDSVLLVGHSGINKAIISVILGNEPDDIKSLGKQYNTGISIFEIDEDKNHKIHLMNCIEHLE